MSLFPHNLQTGYFCSALYRITHGVRSFNTIRGLSHNMYPVTACSPQLPFTGSTAVFLKHMPLLSLKIIDHIRKTDIFRLIGIIARHNSDCRAIWRQRRISSLNIKSAGFCSISHKALTDYSPVFIICLKTQQIIAGAIRPVFDTVKRRSFRKALPICAVIYQILICQLLVKRIIHRSCKHYSCVPGLRRIFIHTDSAYSGSRHLISDGFNDFIACRVPSDHMNPVIPRS